MIITYTQFHPKGARGWLYCLGEMVTSMCSQGVDTINGVIYDTLEWTVAATQSIGHVGFVAHSKKFTNLVPLVHVLSFMLSCKPLSLW